MGLSGARPMKVLKAAGRFIAGPLGAVLFCAAGGFAIWYGTERLREGAPKASPRGEQGTGERTSAGRGSDARVRGDSVASRSDGARKSQAAAGAVAARRRSDAGPKKTARRDADLEEIQAEVESPEPAMEALAADRQQRPSGASAGESTATLISDTIGPRDPRAKDLTEYQAKKAAVPEDAVAQKQMALWCDEHGLWEVAKAHWEAVLRIDPQNEAARRRLGFRLRDRHWVFDATAAEDAVQKKANAYWTRVLEKYHAQMRCRSKVAVPARGEAVTRVEAVQDPRAAAALWKVFGADPSHHGLIVGVLDRLPSRGAAEMLAALAVYSRDEKAQAAAVAALRGRGAAEYGERLVGLMHAPMRVEERLVPVAGGAPVRALLVEGDTKNYRFLFSQVQPPTSDSLSGWFQPRLSAGQIQFVRQFNENQATMARQALDQQVELAKQMIEQVNDSIRALNDRVARVLNEASGAGIRPDPEDARRWLALTQGPAYPPTADRPKPTITEIVAPLYSPTFLPIPAPC
jgi:hypothetical protein